MTYKYLTDVIQTTIILQKQFDTQDFYISAQIKYITLKHIRLYKWGLKARFYGIKLNNLKSQKYSFL